MVPDGIFLTPMKRILLPVVTGLLVLAILADRMTRTASTTLSARASESSADTAAPPARLEAHPALAAAAPKPAPTPAPTVGTPTLDRLARLAVRRQLIGAGQGTYLDSLIATTDSVLRRWPDRSGEPLQVVLMEGSPTGYL